MARTSQKNLLTQAQKLSIQQFVSRVILMTIGALIGAFSVLLFFVPADIAPAGLSGVGVILNNQTGFPIGVFTFVGNIPIMYLAYRMLGGFRAVIWVLYVTVIYSVAVDLMAPYIPPTGVSDDALLNAIFAGMVGGVGSGFIYRAGGSFGGTSTLARILQEKYGMPLSSTFMYSNLLVVGLAGVFLGWESALYSLIALMVEGMASDYMMEGPSVIRTVFIVTERPREVSDVILHVLQRGVTGWEAQGMYTGSKRHMLYVTISRPQAARLRDLVHNVDPSAMIIIGQGHTAYGGGFSRQTPRHNPAAATQDTNNVLYPDYVYNTPDTDDHNTVPISDLAESHERPSDAV